LVGVVPRCGLARTLTLTKLYRLDHVGVGVTRGEEAQLRPLDLVRGRVGVITHYPTP
jgi:hypothetical protein